MTIERGDKLGPVLPDPEPELEEDPVLALLKFFVDDLRQEAPAAYTFDLGIGATLRSDL